MIVENELLKISAQELSELEENSKGKNSANNLVNTNVPRLTDGRQLYISSNIDQLTLTLLLLSDIFCSDCGPVLRLRNR
jgi:hypothetical protein